MIIYFYCTKAKPYLMKGAREFVLLNPNQIDGFTPHSLNGQVVARCVCKEAFDLIADELGNYVPFSVKCNYPADIDVCPKACLSKEQLAEYGKGKDLCAYHLEQVEALEKPMQISDFYSDKNCIKPLKRAPQSFQKAYRKIYVPKDEALDDSDYYVKLCYLFSDQSPFVCKILNGEKDLEIRKSMIEELKKRKGGE